MYYCAMYLRMATEDLSETGLPSKTGVEIYSCTNHFCIRIFVLQL